MYFFVLVVWKGEFRLRLISVIDSLVLAWRGRPGFQVTKFQQVVSSGESRGGTRGGSRPPLFLDQTEARSAEIFFFETGPLVLIQEKMIYLILSCLISGSEWPGPHFNISRSGSGTGQFPRSGTPGRPRLFERLESAIHRINSLSSGQTNRPLPSNRKPHFQNKAKCTTFLVKMSFICIRIKNHFHSKGWALNLVLIQRPGRTRKFPIALSSG